MTAPSEPERLFAQALYEIRLLLAHYLGSSAVKSLHDADLCVRQAAHLSYALHNEALRSLAGEAVDVGPALARLAAVDSMLQSDFVRSFAEQGLHQRKEIFMANPETPGEFGRAVPILRIASLEASLAVLRRGPGLSSGLEGGGQLRLRPPGKSLADAERWRSGSPRHLGLDRGGRRGRLAGRARARGAVIRHPPTNYPWGSRELHVTDPDGHVLRFGADLKKGEPLGEWLDGEGRRWLPSRTAAGRPRSEVG